MAYRTWAPEDIPKFNSDRIIYRILTAQILLDGTVEVLVLYIDEQEIWRSAPYSVGIAQDRTKAPTPIGEWNKWITALGLNPDDYK